MPEGVENRPELHQIIQHLPPGSAYSPAFAERVGEAETPRNIDDGIRLPRVTFEKIERLLEYENERRRN